MEDGWSETPSACNFASTSPPPKPSYQPQAGLIGIYILRRLGFWFCCVRLWCCSGSSLDYRAWRTDVFRVVPSRLLSRHWEAAYVLPALGPFGLASGSQEPGTHEAAGSHWGARIGRSTRPSLAMAFEMDSRAPSHRWCVRNGRSSPSAALG